VRSLTKSVRIACDPEKVFLYLADLANWPAWAVVNVKSIRPNAGSEWWSMVTPHGAALLRLRANQSLGVLDHDFHDPQAKWTVYARVIANGTGAEFMMTFFQPSTFTDEYFDEQLKLVDFELAKLRQILEAA
jgi:hypothetical protein